MRRDSTLTAHACDLDVPRRWSEWPEIEFWDVRCQGSGLAQSGGACWHVKVDVVCSLGGRWGSSGDLLSRKQQLALEFVVAMVAAPVALRLLLAGWLVRVVAAGCAVRGPGAAGRGLFGC